MNYHCVTAATGWYVLEPDSDAPGDWLRIPIIGWVISLNSAPVPVSLNGVVTSDKYGLEMPNGRVMDRDLEGSDNIEQWKKRRILHDTLEKYGPASFHERNSSETHDA